jgi:glycerophosphoryl diester phosphodiesterase
MFHGRYPSFKFAASYSICDEMEYARYRLGMQCIQMFATCQVQSISKRPANIRVVKESGLVCVSYGKDNDDKVFVRKQIEAGVDAVIVDSVLAIRNELTSGGFQSS